MRAVHQCNWRVGLADFPGFCFVLFASLTWEANDKHKVVFSLESSVGGRGVGWECRLKDLKALHHAGAPCPSAWPHSCWPCSGSSLASKDYFSEDKGCLISLASLVLLFLGNFFFLKAFLDFQKAYHWLIRRQLALGWCLEQYLHPVSAHYCSSSFERRNWFCVNPWISVIYIQLNEWIPITYFSKREQIS